jgi:general secretion pathway protein H
VVAKRNPPNAGFTLVELSLVLLIIGLAAALVVPRFRDRSHSDLISHARRLAVTFRFLRQEAILNGRIYRLTYDLGEHRYWITSAEDRGDESQFERESGMLGKVVTLPPPVAFSDVVLPFTAGRVVEGLAATHFYPDGYIDETIVHLDNGTDVYTLAVMNPLTGRVAVVPGYHEVDYSA